MDQAMIEWRVPPCARCGEPIEGTPDAELGTFVQVFGAEGDYYYHRRCHEEEQEEGLDV